MKKINILYASFWLTLSVALLSCEQAPIDEFKSYVPNKPPVIAQFSSDYNGADIVPGLKISLHVEAADPDGTTLTYEFISGNGSFTNKNLSNLNAACDVDFIIGDITGNEAVIAKVQVTDSEGAATIQSLDIGTGKVGPRIKQLNEVKTIITSDECSHISFSSDSDGYYQVLLFDDPDIKTATIDETKTMFLINKDEPVSFDICGPNAAFNPVIAGIPTLNPINQTPDSIFLIVSDKMRQESAQLLSFSIVGSSPQLTGNGAITVSSIADNSIGIDWIPAVDSDTLQQDLEYKVYYSKEKPLASLQDIESYGTAAGDWEKSIAHKTILNLQHNTFYYINVVVRDEEDNRIMYTMQTASTSAAASLQARISPGLDINYHGVIPYTQVFAITFNKPINSARLAVSGTMAVESNVTWSPNNDKITISPKTTWTSDSNRTLTITCIDPDYDTPLEIPIQVHILDQNIYVSDTGNDSNPGTRDLPKASIPQAITLAKQFFATANVKVAAGMYQVNTYNPKTYIVMQEGISLYGGYSPTDWEERDPETYVSVIIDFSDTGTLNKAIDCGKQVTNATIVDGFSIGVWYGNTTYAFYCYDSSPTIQNNIINSNNGYSIAAYHNAAPLIKNNRISSSQNASISIYDNSAPVIKNNTISTNNGYGIAIYHNSIPLIQNNTIWGDISIYSEYSSPIIHNNELAGYNVAILNHFSSCTLTNNYITSSGIGIFQTGDTSSLIQANTISFVNSNDLTIGIAITESNSAPLIRNNTIFGGNGAISSRGIYLSLSNAIIQNNTIHGGASPAQSTGIIFSESSPTIENNIIFTSGSGTRYCIQEEAPGSNPASIRNNNLFGCPSALYFDMDAPATLVDIADVNNPSLTGAALSSDNLDVDLVSGSYLQDSDLDFTTLTIQDWKLLDGVPSVANGGLDLSTSFTLDKDGLTRTAPWSIGAYEKN